MINFKFEITEIKEDVIATSTLSTTHYAKSNSGLYFEIFYNTTTGGWNQGSEITEIGDPELYNLLDQAGMKEMDNKNFKMISGYADFDGLNLYYINDQGKVVECIKDHHFVQGGM